MKSLPDVAIFALLFFSSFGIFAWSARRLSRHILRGRLDEKRFDRWPQRLVDVLVYFVGQKKVGESVSYDAAAKGITSKHHIIIFWGFLIIQVGALEMFLQGFGLESGLSFVGVPVYHTIKLSVAL